MSTFGGSDPRCTGVDGGQGAEVGGQTALEWQMEDGKWQMTEMFVCGAGKRSVPSVPSVPSPVFTGLFWVLKRNRAVSEAYQSRIYREVRRTLWRKEKEDEQD